MLGLWECLTCGNSLEKQLAMDRLVGRGGEGWRSLCFTLMGKNLWHQFVSAGEEGEGVSVVWSTTGPFEEPQPFSTRMRVEKCELKGRKYAQGVRT